MTDILMLAVGSGAFGALAAYAISCERL